MADTVVGIGADLSELRRELAKLPNLSGDAAQKMLVNVERRVAQAERVAKASARAVSREAKHAQREAQKMADDAIRGAKGIFELGGGSGEIFEKVGDVAAAATSPVGLFALGLTGVGVAGVAAAGGVAALVAQADEMDKKLAPFRELEGFEGLDPQVRDSVLRANDAMDGMSVIGARLVELWGGEFAPAVEKAMFLALKFGLIITDQTQALLESKNVVRELAVTLVQNLVEGFTAPVGHIVNLIGLLGDLAGALGDETLAQQLSAVEERWDSFTRGVAETAVDFYIDKGADAVHRLDEATAGYDERAQAMLGTLAKVREAQDKVTESTGKQAEAVKTQLELMQELADKQGEQADKAQALVDQVTAHRLSALEKVRGAEHDALADLEAIRATRLDLAAEDAAMRELIEIEHQEKVLAILEEFGERRRELRAEEAEAAAEARAAEIESVINYADSATGVLGGLTDAWMAATEKQSGASRKAMQMAFAAQKAMALSDVAVKTAQGVMAVWATWAAIPAVAGALSGAVLATGAIQAGLIAGEKPKFHTGTTMANAGQIGQAGPPAPDEIDRRTLRDEGTVTRRGIQTLEELNRGRLGGGGPAPVVYKNRHLDEVMHDHLQLANTALGEAINADRRPGRMTRRA